MSMNPVEKIAASARSTFFWQFIELENIEYVGD